MNPFIIAKRINDSALDACTKGILNRLKNLEGNAIATVIARFENPEGVFNLNVSQGVIPTQPNVIRLGQTDPANEPNYNIILNENHFNNSSMTHLLKAQAIIHEIFHALIFSVINNPTIPNQDSSDFEVIWSAYINHKFGNNNSEHHEFMANNYIEIIGSILQEYDTGIPVPDNQSPMLLYTDMAWIGLIKIPSTEPTTFDGILTNADKARLLGRFGAELTRAPSNGIQPSSTNSCRN